VTQCTATSKRTGQRCGGQAVIGFTVCRLHGARGGPKTGEGKRRIALAQAKHGRRSKAGVAEQSASKRVRALLEKILIYELAGAPVPEQLIESYAVAMETWAEAHEALRKFQEELERCNRPPTAAASSSRRD